MILNLFVQFRVSFFLVSLLVLVIHLILLLSCKYFACFICFFFSLPYCYRSVLQLFYLHFVFFNFCFSVPLWFVSNRMPSLRFSCRKARFNKSFKIVRSRSKRANAATSPPFFNFLPIVPGFCITISIRDSLLQTQLLRFLLLFGLLHVLERILRYFQGT